MANQTIKQAETGVRGKRICQVLKLTAQTDSNKQLDLTGKYSGFLFYRDFFSPLSQQHHGTDDKECKRRE